MAEPQKTSQLEIDELTRTIDEYRVKVDEIVRKERESLRQLVDKESSHIINGAWQKAEEIIAESQQEAQKIREEMEHQARKESSEIINEAKYKAQQIIGEAEERAKKEAKKRTKAEADKIISKARQDSSNIVSHAGQAAEKEASEIIARSRKEAERLVKEEAEKCRVDAQVQSARVISEAKKKVERVIDDVITSSTEMSKLLMEIMHKTETIMDRFRNELQIELSESAKVIAVAKMKLEEVMAENDEKSETVEAIPHINEELNKNAVLSVQLEGEKSRGGNGSNHLFRGQMELKTMSSYDYLQIKKLKNVLAKVPNIKYVGECSSEEEMIILFEVEEPLPLLDILSNVPLVEKVVEQKDSVMLILQD